MDVFYWLSKCSQGEGDTQEFENLLLQFMRDVRNEAMPLGCLDTVMGKCNEDMLQCHAVCT